MNNEGILDSKDLRILYLEELINKFKAYDNHRKKYYSNALIELGALQSYTLELEDVINNDDKLLTIKNQRNELRIQNKLLQEYKIRIKELEEKLNLTSI